MSLESRANTVQSAPTTQKLIATKLATALSIAADTELTLHEIDTLIAATLQTNRAISHQRVTAILHPITLNGGRAAAIASVLNNTDQLENVLTDQSQPPELQAARKDLKVLPEEKIIERLDAIESALFNVLLDIATHKTNPLSNVLVSVLPAARLLKPTFTLKTVSSFEELMTQVNQEVLLPLGRHICIELTPQQTITAYSYNIIPGSWKEIDVSHEHPDPVWAADIEESSFSYPDYVERAQINGVASYGYAFVKPEAMRTAKSEEELDSMKIFDISDSADFVAFLEANPKIRSMYLGGELYYEYVLYHEVEHIVNQRRIALLPETDNEQLRFYRAHVKPDSMLEYELGTWEIADEYHIYDQEHFTAAYEFVALVNGCIRAMEEAISQEEYDKAHALFKEFTIGELYLEYRDTSPDGAYRKMSGHSMASMFFNVKFPDYCRTLREELGDAAWHRRHISINELDTLRTFRQDNILSFDEFVDAKAAREAQVIADRQDDAFEVLVDEGMSHDDALELVMKSDTNLDAIIARRIEQK